MTDEPLDPVEGEEASDGAPSPEAEPDEAESPTTDPENDEVSQMGQLEEEPTYLADVPVKDLPDVLQEISDPYELRKYRDADDRSTAREHYDRRLEILAATGADVDEGKATGYTVGRYYSSAREEELPNYECASCAYSTLHLERIERHVAIEHRASESREETP